MSGGRTSLASAQGTGALRLLFEKMEARAASKSPTLSHGRTSPTRSRRSKTPSSLRPTPLPHATPAPAATAAAAATATAAAAAGPRVQTPTPAELMASLEAPRRASPPRRAAGGAVAVADADAEVAAVNRVETEEAAVEGLVEVPASAQPLALPTWRKSRRAEVVEVVAAAAVAAVAPSSLPPPRPTALDAEHDHGLRSMQEQPPLA